MPARLRAASEWRLLYSTNYHGFSLSTVFARSKGWPGPVMAIVRDTEGCLFGAFLTEPFAPHIGHFGTGECFLWKMEDDGRVKRFKSTGFNDYFMLCETGFIAVGCGDGRFGLWLDAQLDEGRTQSVPTFDNEPLSRTETFQCVTFELWGLVCDN
jgi:hypothetical protein